MTRPRKSFSAEPVRGGFELFGAGGVKNVQRGEYQFNNADYAEITISPVDLSSSIIIINERATANAGPDNIKVRADFKNGQTIELRTFDASFSIVNWQVIEFTGVKSLQRGVRTVTSSGTNISISPINVGKSILFFSFTSSEYVSRAADMTMSGKIVDQNTLHFRVYGNNATVSWSVVEFN